MELLEDESDLLVSQVGKLLVVQIDDVHLVEAILAACGGFITAEKDLTPNIPRFVMVKVPFVTSL